MSDFKRKFRYRIGDKEEILVIGSGEPNFDRACDVAYEMAVERFGIDEDGYSSRVADWERSSCSVRVEFMKMIRTGHTHVYVFEADTEKTQCDLLGKED